MSDITINVGVDETMLISAGAEVLQHSSTHISGGSDELNHNLLAGLQGGSGGQYYHLSSEEYFNLVTGQVIRSDQTGLFYPNSNPSGFITGIDLSPYSTITYVTGVSGQLQAQITVLSNQTGQFYLNSNPSGFITGVDLSSYVLNTETGQFYSSSNPSGYTATGYVTGISGGLQTQITTLNNQTGSYYPRTNPSGYITGVDLSFSGNYYTKTESESRYVNTTGAEIILGNKTFHDNVYINNLYVTGLETIVNTTNTNVASNYIMLNLTGGAVDGGLFFVTGSGLTGINNSGAIIGFDHSDKFKFGISTRASDLSTLSTIASVEQMTGISGGLQTQISTLNNQTGSYVLKIESGQFYPNSNPSGFITNNNLLPYATQSYVTGISGSLQTQITTLNNQTGQFYLNSNPSGYLNSLLTSKTIYVDANTGSDTRNEFSKYDLFKPFATISAAVAASVTGDLIYVRAGTYTISSQINLNLKGHLYFDPGTTVSVATGIVAFSYSQNSVPIYIKGEADFMLTGTAGVLTMPSGNAATAVTFECNSISGPNTASGTLFNCAVGVLSVDVKAVQMTTTFTASNAVVFNITGSGRVTARIPFAYCGVFVNGAGASAGTQINADIWTLATYNGTAGMNLNLISTSFRIVNYSHVGVGVAFSWTENTTRESHVFRGVNWASSPLGAAQMTFASTAGSTSLKRINLEQTNILRGATTNSLSASVPIDIYTYGSFATAPANANVTFKVGAFTVDAAV